LLYDKKNVESKIVKSGLPIQLRLAGVTTLGLARDFCPELGDQVKEEALGQYT
jgi:hypothetical protein